MKKSMLPFLVLFTFLTLSCGSFQIQREQSDEITLQKNPSRARNLHINFHNLLPHDEETTSGKNLEAPVFFNEMYGVTPVFPEGEELQRCIGSILVSVSGDSPTRRINMISFAICFENSEDVTISEQTGNELRVFVRILARDPNNHLLLLVPEEVQNHVIARRRIEAVRNFLIREGAQQSKIIEIFDAPPE